MRALSLLLVRLSKEMGPEVMLAKKSAFAFGAAREVLPR